MCASKGTEEHGDTLH